MNKPWLDHYPEGVPTEIHTDSFTSLGQFLEASFEKHAQNPFSVCMERWMSFAELDRHSAAMGAWLQQQGLATDARIALMLPNIPQFAVTMSGILRAGFTCVNVNPLYTARELEHQLKDSGATAIVILENFAHTLQPILDRTQVQVVVVATLGDMLGALYGRWITFAVRHLAKLVPRYALPAASANGLKRTITTFQQALSAGHGMRLQPATTNLDSVAFLQYTGGTTGLSKGAVLTHRNVIAAVLQAEAWFSPALKRIGDVSKSNSIAALPLYHIFALTLCFLSIRWGSQMTLIPNPRDIPKFVGVLKRRPFHLMPAVNTLFNALLAASEGTAREWQKVTGCAMVEGWGMSETCAIGTNNPIDTTVFSGTIGLPLPSIDIAIKDDDGQDVPAGHTGEICIRGPNVMTGYYQQPEENLKAFTADGFMRTGDIGVMDERGYTRIVDRKKDMILVSGFNVFPNELENVVSLCPGVLECAAVGVPDDKQGEAIKLFVVRKDPALTEEMVSAYCRDQLTGYKVPKYIEFRTELPKTNVGKILRRELRSPH